MSDQIIALSGHKSGFRDLIPEVTLKNLKGCLSEHKEKFQDSLLHWYDREHRVLPWREDPTPNHMTMAFVAYLLCCLGIICGSAFHSECAHLDLMGRYDEKPQLDEVMKYLDFQKVFLAVFSLIGYALLIAMIVPGYTVLPWWAVLFTPPVVLLLTPLVSRLPKGIHMIVRGGWTNIITVIYYVALLVMMVN